MVDDTATVLLTLGRLPVALEIARAFHHAGYRVIVAEPFSWPLCRLSNSVDKCFRVTAPTVDKAAYQAELLAIVAAENVTLLVPVSEEILFVAGCESSLPDTTSLVSMDQETLLLLHDKWRFAMWAAKHGLPVPPTVLADDDEAVAALLVSEHVVKPRLSCSGVGVRFGHEGQALLASECTDGKIVQERLRGSSCSTFSIVVQGRVLVSVAYRGLLQSGSVSVCFERINMPETIDRYIGKAAALLNFSGMLSFDFLQTETGQWQAIECNPRATSGIHFIHREPLLSCLQVVAAGQSGSLPSVCCLPTGTRRQEFWSCLTEVQGDLLKLKWNGVGWQMLFGSTDISFSSGDMKPFFLMPLVLAPQLWQALRNRQPVSELLMLDVGWYS
ncbi:MAG: ATP-grasp domain-containing protein [Granulosicoccus sp.]